MPEIKQFACDKCGDIIPQMSSRGVSGGIHGVIITGKVTVASGVGDLNLVGGASHTSFGDITIRSMFCVGCLLDVLQLDISDIKEWLKGRTVSKLGPPR